jgi:hypothetical protein
MYRQVETKALQKSAKIFFESFQDALYVFIGKGSDRPSRLVQGGTNEHAGYL